MHTFTVTYADGRHVNIYPAGASNPNSWFAETYRSTGVRDFNTHFAPDEVLGAIPSPMERAFREYLDELIDVTIADELVQAMKDSVVGDHAKARVGLEVAAAVCDAATLALHTRYELDRVNECGAIGGTDDGRRAVTA